MESVSEDIFLLRCHEKGMKDAMKEKQKVEEILRK
jgi:hypothetical protein